MVKVFLYLLSCMGLCIMTACASYDNNDVPFSELVRHFQKRGLKVEYIIPLEKENVSAEAAFAFHIGARDIGIYKYDRNVKKHVRYLERVSDTGIFYVRGRRYPAIRNGSFIMIDHETHQDKQKIVEAFKAFGKKK